MTDTTANTLPIFAANPKVEGHEFVPADTTTQQVIYTAGSEGAVITAIVATSQEVTSYDVRILIDNHIMGWIPVPARAAHDAGIPAVNLLENAGILPWLQADGSLLLGPGQELQGRVSSDVTTQLAVTALGGDY